MSAIGTMVICRCCNPGCCASVRLAPLKTICGPVDLTEGLCADCLVTVPVDRRQCLRMARLELRLSPGLAQIVLFLQSWEAVKMAAAERSAWRIAA